nr:MAG TPA: hypothetical protein [Caudoviricetes sp.]
MRRRNSSQSPEFLFISVNRASAVLNKSLTFSMDLLCKNQPSVFLRPAREERGLLRFVVLLSFKRRRADEFTAFSAWETSLVSVVITFCSGAFAMASAIALAALACFLAALLAPYPPNVAIFARAPPTAFNGFELITTNGKQLNKLLRHAERIVAAVQPTLPEGRKLPARAVKCLTLLLQSDKEHRFTRGGQLVLQLLPGPGADNPVHHKPGAVDVQRALQNLPGIPAPGIEKMVPQHKLRGRKSVRTQPGTYGGGIIQDVLETSLPGLFTPSGIQQDLQSVKHGRFNAVANAANLPLAALVGGGKAGNAQGIRPGNAAVFKPEDSRSHLSFCRIHRYQLFLLELVRTGKKNFTVGVNLAV